jgi:hypothetical protein
LQSGQVDFSTLDITDAVIAYGKGAVKDFTIVSAIQQRNVACLTAPQGSGITSPRDLAGKKIAYIPGGVVRDLFDTYAKLAGVDGVRPGQWRAAGYPGPRAVGAQHRPPGSCRRCPRRDQRRQLRLVRPSP